MTEISRTTAMTLARLIARCVTLAVAAVTTGCPVDTTPDWCVPPCTWQERDNHWCNCPREEFDATTKDKIMSGYPQTQDPSIMASQDAATLGAQTYASVLMVHLPNTSRFTGSLEVKVRGRAVDQNTEDSFDFESRSAYHVAVETDGTTSILQGPTELTAYTMMPAELDGIEYALVPINEAFFRVDVTGIAGFTIYWTVWIDEIQGRLADQES